MLDLNEYEDIYTITILDEVFSYRLISRGELRRAQNQAAGNSVEFEDLICKQCTISIPDTFAGWDECLAGIPSMLAQAILNASGFLSEDSVRALEQEAANWVKTQDSRFDALITFCHPTITDIELDNMSPKRWHKLAAKSQLIAAGLYGIDTSGFLDTSEDTKVQTEKPQIPQQQTNINNPSSLQPQEHGINKAASHIETEGTFSFKR